MLEQSYSYVGTSFTNAAREAMKSLLRLYIPEWNVAVSEKDSGARNAQFC